jgi:creatinine amidohydrolase
MVYVRVLGRKSLMGRVKRAGRTFLMEGVDVGRQVWLHNLTWEEVKRKTVESKGTVILPVGSTEQHGAHLPVGTDTMVAIALAESAAREANALIAPPLWFGWSPHHMILPGTITVRPEVLIEVVYDVVSSLSQHGFERFIFLNGHRIVNVAWLQIAAERAKRELGVRVALFDPAYMSREVVEGLGWGEVGHADEIESSHMWHCYPDLVKMDRATDNPHAHRPLYHVDPGYGGDTLCYVPSSPGEQAALVLGSGGTSGEPSKAGPEGGRKYHEHLVGRLVAAIEMMRAQE